MSSGELGGGYLIDSHCHLQSLAPVDCERALENAREAGVRGFLVPAIRLSDAERLLELCRLHDDVWCALGVHPHDASSWQEGDDLRLESLLREPDVVAVGECGLDFFYDNSPRDIQERVMRQQWEIAVSADLPVIVHNRDSNETMLAIVAEPQFTKLQADFHSFAGGADMARDLLARGFLLGLSGMVTFPRADNVREVIPSMDPKQALIETDTPYLAPVPHRGKQNEPQWVVEVARRLAVEQGVDLAEVAAVTSANFFRLFSKADAASAK